MSSLRRLVTGSVVALSFLGTTLTIDPGTAVAAPTPPLGGRADVNGDGATAAPLPRTTSALSDDFNGDGYHDTVVGAPDAAVSGHRGAGSVTVLYGAAGGPAADHSQSVSQATAGVPGSPEKGDWFGAATASADLDYDGYADLVVGVPYEDVGAASDKGMVEVLWGSPAGLAGGAAVAVTKEDLGYADDASGCKFGLDLAATGGASYDRPEVLAASWCMVADFVGPFTRSGAPDDVRPEDTMPSLGNVAAADLDGDRVADHVDVSLDVFPSGSVFLNPRDYHPLPKALQGRASNAAFGDVNGDGHPDLVAGDPGNPNPDAPDSHVGGRVLVWLGSAGGIDETTEPVELSQSTPGVPGASETPDQFGYDVTVGDLDGDGKDDIVVGVPGEQLSSVTPDAGAVVVIPGHSGAPDGSGAYAVSQSTAGVPGGPESEDVFGTSVRLTDMTGDGRLDLVVGVPGENIYVGGICFFPGTGDGLDLQHTTALMGDTVGVSTHYPGWSAELAPAVP